MLELYVESGDDVRVGVGVGSSVEVGIRSLIGVDVGVRVVSRVECWGRSLVSGRMSRSILDRV